MLYPIYNLTWVPIALQSLIDDGAAEWFHTSHKCSIDIDELEKIQDKD